MLVSTMRLRNANVFRISTVVKKQVFAEIFLVFRAVEAHLAGRGIQSDDAHTLFESPDAVADFFDDSSQFVAEESGRNDHASMIAALVALQVGSARQRYLHLDQHFPIAYTGNRNLLNLKILFAVKDAAVILPFMLDFLLPSRPAELLFSLSQVGDGQPGSGLQRFATMGICD